MSRSNLPGYQRSGPRSDRISAAERARFDQFELDGLECRTKNCTGSSERELGHLGRRTPQEVDRLVAKFFCHVRGRQRDTAQPDGRMGCTEAEGTAASTVKFC